MQAITAIGITQKPNLLCTGVNISDSDSGLYLDQLPGLGADYFASDGEYGSCNEPKSYLNRMVLARAEALDLVEEAIIRGLKGEHKLQTFPHNWYIGQRSGVGLATASQLNIKTGRFLDAYLHISKIGVVASGTGSAIVTLNGNSYVIEIDKSGYTGVEVALKLPLDGSEYTFEVETTGTVKLQNNSIGCGCGAKDTALYGYMRFNASYAAGISLDATIGCDVETTLSRLHTTDKNVQKVMARMLYYRAGVVLCDFIFGEVQPQEHDTNLEYVAAKRAELLQEFESRLQWLLETGINVENSACFSCSGPRVVSIGR
ncbi:hypothetical protein [Pontibacter beigongshangensis]|uniref:hypothetical protein n=1 Tax=Pontibacter beigongshangensis TaxID=2574733 RepID=UPI001650345C|nr:hypothetical protein [Pontibacter beigongshangensis]